MQMRLRQQLDRHPSTRVWRLFFASSIVMACAIAFGSWAPFDIQESSLAIAWRQFFAVQSHFSRSDVLVNVLLAIPFTFAVCGSLAGDRRSAWSATGNVVIALVVLAFLSLACEIGQSWIAGRVPSALDWIAQQIGGAVGCIAWMAGGRKLTEEIANATSSQPVSHRLEHVLTLFVVAVVIWTLLPGDLLLTPKQLAAKWAAGDIEVIPFSRGGRGLLRAIYQCAASFLILLPVGIWLQRTLLRMTGHVITVPNCLLLGFIVGVLPELLQVLVISRVASATDALFGILGATSGLILASRFQQKNRLTPRHVGWLTQPATWFAMGIAYLILLSLVSLAPFEFTHDYDEIRDRVIAWGGSPFTKFGGDPLTTGFVIFRDLCWSVPAGILLGVGVGLFHSRHAKLIVGGLTIGFLAVVGSMIEIGRLLEMNRDASGNDLVLRLFAFFAGFVAGVVFVRPFQNEGRTAPHQTRRQQSDSLTAELCLPASASQSYIRGFDGLRAIACLAVFGVHWQHATQVDFHFGFIDGARLLKNGNTGVAVFMALSGFLLATPIWAMTDQQRSRYRLRQFFLRRAIRILPAYLFALVAVVLATGHWKSPKALFDVLTHLAFVHNFFPGTLYSISTPFWAMAVFVQYYLFFGVFVYITGTLGIRSNRSLGIAFAAVACITQALCVWLATVEADSSSQFWLGPNAVGLKHSLLFHLNIFLLGVAASYIDTRLRRIPSVYADVAILAISILMIAILGTPLDEIITSHFGRYNFPVVPALIACSLVLVPRTRWLGVVLEWAPVVLLGSVSYGFYLFHEPIMKFLAEFGQVGRLPPVLFGVVSFASAATVSIVFFRLVERPLIGRSHASTRFHSK